MELPGLVHAGGGERGAELSSPQGRALHAQRASPACGPATGCAVQSGEGARLPILWM